LPSRKTRPSAIANQAADISPSETAETQFHRDLLEKDRPLLVPQKAVSNVPSLTRSNKSLSMMFAYVKDNNPFWYK
jgi:hypothetical protein